MEIQLKLNIPKYERILTKITQDIECIDLEKCLKKFNGFYNSKPYVYLVGGDKELTKEQLYIKLRIQHRNLYQMLYDNTCINKYRFHIYEDGSTYLILHFCNDFVTEINELKHELGDIMIFREEVKIPVIQFKSKSDTMKLLKDYDEKIEVGSILAQVFLTSPDYHAEDYEFVIKHLTEE